MRYMSSGLVVRMPRNAWNTTTGGNVVLRGSVFTSGRCGVCRGRLVYGR